MNLTDPTGKNPMEECFLIVAPALRPLALTGLFPDNYGMCVVLKVMDPSPGNELNTYIAAGVAIESNFYFDWIDTRGGLYYRFFPKKLNYWSSGLGICNISDAQMETVWGKPILKSDGTPYGGNGFNLWAGGQEDPSVAVMAMGSRIMLVTNECWADCSETDIFIVAALAEGSNLFQQDIKFLKANYRKTPSTPNGMKFDWDSYLYEKPGSTSHFRAHDSSQIRLFSNDVKTLHWINRDWYVPDINWTEIDQLIEKLKK